MKRLRSISPTRHLTRVDDTWKLVGEGTHGKIFASPDAAHVIKQFPTRNVSHYAICHLKDDPDCELVIEPVSAATNREAKIQEVARAALKQTLRRFDVELPRPRIPKITSFDETPRNCYVGMQRLFPPGRSDGLIQINTAEADRFERNSQGIFLGVAQLSRLLLDVKSALSVPKVVRDIAFLYATMHFEACIDAYDVEFVIACFEGERWPVVAAIDFDKVQQITPQKAYPYCVCRKIAEGQFVPHKMMSSNHLHRFLASAINSSGVVPHIACPLRDTFIQAYEAVGSKMCQASQLWEGDAPHRVIAYLHLLME